MSRELEFFAHFPCSDSHAADSRSDIFQRQIKLPKRPPIGKVSQLQRRLFFLFESKRTKTDKQRGLAVFWWSTDAPTAGILQSTKGRKNCNYSSLKRKIGRWSQCRPAKRGRHQEPCDWWPFTDWPGIRWLIPSSTSCFRRVTCGLWSSTFLIFSQPLIIGRHLLIETSSGTTLLLLLATTISIFKKF